MLLQKINDFRNSQILLLKGKHISTYLGNVTSANVTKLSGGVQSNVIPPEMTITVDFRLAPDVCHEAFEAQLNQWCEEAGGGIKIEFDQKEVKVDATKIDDSNEYWVAFKEATDELGLEIRPSVCPGGTDIRFVRALGIPAFGFSPINNTEFLLHDHDEHLSVEVYLRGIQIYKKLIEKLSKC